MEGISNPYSLLCSRYEWWQKLLPAGRIGKLEQLRRWAYRGAEEKRIKETKPKTARLDRDGNDRWTKKTTKTNMNCASQFMVCTQHTRPKAAPSAVKASVWTYFSTTLCKLCTHLHLKKGKDWMLSLPFLKIISYCVINVCNYINRLHQGVPECITFAAWHGVDGGGKSCNGMV